MLDRGKKPSSKAPKAARSADTGPSAPVQDLALAYGSGLLLPFIGAGLSAPTCPLWPEFVVRLETATGVSASQDLTTNGDTLIRRAAKAVRKLRNESPSSFAAAVKTAIYGKSRQIESPATTKALADIWWPLVVSTNYDSLFVDAWNDRWVVNKNEPLPQSTEMVPLGRGALDCQRVLNSLRAPDQSLLWAVQGFVGPFQEQTVHPLCNQLVVGHEEYRRETYAAFHFRRAFAELYRSRIFLFLGAGLEDPYFLELFGEIVELLGSVPHMHYALVPKEKVDSDFLLRRLQIRTIEYEPTEPGGHSERVFNFLSNLRQAIESERPRTVRWSFRLDAGHAVRRRDSKPDVEIIRGGDVPKRAPANEAFAVSARRDGENLDISNSGRKSLSKLFDLRCPEYDPPANVNAPVHRIKGTNAYVVVTRLNMVNDGDFRDARNIAPGMEALLKRVVADGCTKLHTYPLASGSRRTFPPYFALLEMLRGYRKHFRNLPDPRIQMAIYTENPLILHLLNSRRIDPLEVLASDEIRFWIEIWRGSDLSRVLDSAPGNTPILDILNKHDIPLKRWTYSVTPSPTKFRVETQVERLATNPGLSAPKVTLESEGVFTGSTLRIRPVAP
jgi:hypothetical protein